MWCVQELGVEFSCLVFVCPLQVYSVCSIFFTNLSLEILGQVERVHDLVAKELQAV